MNFLALQAPDISSGDGGSIAVLIVATTIVFLQVFWRRTRALSGMTLDEARRALATLEQEGRRDVRTEAHVAALLSWSAAYAALLFLSFAAAGFFDTGSPEEEARWAADRGTSRVFAGLLAAEAFGLWSAARGMARGRERVRWSASALLTLVSLTSVGVGLFQAGHWSAGARISNLVLHGAVAVYAVAGAVFLLLPRCARLCAPEYREIVRETKGAATDVAVSFARMKSPFSWVPVALLVVMLVLKQVLKS